MNTKNFKRRLTAILSADVEGYSRLMRDDEDETIRTITAYRTAIARLVEQYRGRVVDSPGDNILSEFGSSVDAVNCAVEVQRELAERNAELPENRRMQFRIGVNSGDVVEEGERIYGDGVNIAARIESLAEGGGICVSGTVYDSIEGKLGLEFENLGEHEVKNIDKLIRVYRILSYPGAAAHRVVKAKKAVGKTWRNKMIAIAAVLVIAAAAWAVWHFYFRPLQIEPASVEKMAFPLPEKPSIAVLPFDNLSGNPEQEYIADGITENIISALSKIPEMFVIARNSAFIYKGKPVKVQKVSEEFGVRYVLEGSVQKSGDRIRVTAQLIDATKGHHLWSEQYDRDMKDLFALQDDITKEIVVALQVKLTEGEQARLRYRSTDNLKAWSYGVKAYSLFERYNKADNAKARELFEEAIKQDPDYAWAWTWLAWTYWIDARFGFSLSRLESFKRAIEVAQKAVALDESNPEVHALLECLHLFRKEYEKAIAEGERAILLGPNNAEIHSLLAMTMFQVGRFEEAIVLSERAMRLSPFYPSWYLLPLGAANLFLGQYEKAIEAFKKCLERAKKEGGAILIFTRCYLAAAYIELGREEEARSQVGEILKINPKFSMKWVRKASFWKDPAQLHRFLDDLRKAGVPETPPLPLPDKPSIAVLPFVNMSGDPDQEYFSDGLTEDIITALSKTPQLFVIARHSTFKYKGKSVGIPAIGRQLGVRYVLEGSVRKSGNTVRITAQLIDAKTNKHFWAERYDRDLKEIFAVQDDITKNIITALHVQLTEGEDARLTARGTDNLQAYLKCSKATWYNLQSTKESVFKAKQLAEEAIALDPNYAFAYTVLGASYGIPIFLGISKSPGESLKRAIELSQKAIALDDSLGRAHAALGYWLIVARQYDKAIAEGQRSMALEPNSGEVIYNYASILTFAGKLEEAVPLFKEAIRLNPIPPNSYLRHFGIALRDSGRYEEAIVQAKRAIEQEPNDSIAWIILVSSLALAGRDEKARTAAKEILRISPNFSVAQLEKRAPQKDRAAVKRFCDALRKVGLPE